MVDQPGKVKKVERAVRSGEQSEALCIACGMSTALTKRVAGDWRLWVNASHEQKGMDEL